MPTPSTLNETDLILLRRLTAVIANLNRYTSDATHSEAKALASIVAERFDVTTVEITARLEVVA